MVGFLSRAFKAGLMRVCKGTDACAVPVLSPEEVSKYEVSKSSYPEPHPTIIGLSRDHVSANTDFIRLRAYRATTPSVAVCPTSFVDVR